MRILIIEDEASLAHALELKLTQKGFITTIAADGHEGLEHALTGRYRVILLDLTLPGVDGFAILDALHACKSRIPVVVLTNVGNDAARRRAADLGAAAFLVKANTALADVVRLVTTFCD